MFEVAPVSEDTLLISFARGDVNVVPSMVSFIENNVIGLLDIAPAYSTILLRYDILSTDEENIVDALNSWQYDSAAKQQSSSTTHQIPVYYHEEVAADLSAFCKLTNMTATEVADLHSQQVYDVYAIGFRPGFAYLGYVNERLEMPRHDSFKSTVPAGSVAIADRQTAIYPCESPGGWRVIGRTAVSVYQHQQALFKVGDKVQFVPVSRQEYLGQGGVLS